MARSRNGSIEFPVSLKKPISTEERTRSQTGPYNITFATSEDFLNKILKAIQQIKISVSGHYDKEFNDIPILEKAKFSVDINIKDAQFPQNGQINLTDSGDNGKLEIQDLDLVFPNTKIKGSLDIKTLDKIKILDSKEFIIPLRKVFALDDLLQISVGIPTNLANFKDYVEDKLLDDEGFVGVIWDLLPGWLKDAINWVRDHSGIEVVIKYFSKYKDWLNKNINFSSINNSITTVGNTIQRTYEHNANGLEVMFNDLGLDLKKPPQNMDELKSQLNIPGIPDEIPINTPPIDIPLPIPLFSNNPDLPFSLEIPKFTFFELTLACIRFKTKYGKGNNQDIPNRWRFYILPTLPFLGEPFDFIDKLTELVTIIKNSIDNFLSSTKQVLLQFKDNVIEKGKEIMIKQIFAKIIQQFPILDVLKQALEDFLKHFSDLLGWIINTITSVLQKINEELSNSVIKILGTIDQYAKNIARYIVEEDHLGIYKKIDSWIEKLLEDYPVLEIPDPLVIDNIDQQPIEHPIHTTYAKKIKGEEFMKELQTSLNLNEDKIDEIKNNILKKYDNLYDIFEATKKNASSLDEFNFDNPIKQFILDKSQGITIPLVKIAPKIPIEYLDIQIKSKELLFGIDIGKYK